MQKPIEEVVDEREFTNRDRELKFLWQLVQRIKIKQGASHAIIARKGVGKTALLVSFYNQLFTAQSEVIPFYLSFAEFKKKDGQLFKRKIFIEYYFRTLVIQYLAFKLKKPELLLMLKDYDFMRLKEFIHEKGFEVLLTIFESFIDLWQNKNYDMLMYSIVHFTKDFLVRVNENGILMIDEFQVLTSIWDEEEKQAYDITEIFQKTAESKRCPMLVTGSAVHLITKTVFGGLLARRFSPLYLKPFSVEHSVEYAQKLAGILSIQITEEVAVQIHQFTGGNPFYLWCICNSHTLEHNDLTTLTGLENVYNFELNDTSGKLKGFWDTHFDSYAKLINDDEIGIQVLYYMASSRGNVSVQDLAISLKKEAKEVKRVLKNLEQADLIQRKTGGIYDRITDPVLADYIEREYRTDFLGQELESYLTAFSKEIKRRQGNLAKLLGENAELYTRNLLLKFKGQVLVPAEVFGITGAQIQLPTFTSVENRGGVILRGDVIEFDLLADGTEQWLVEVKYWNKPVALKEIDQFLQKVKNMAGWELPPAAGKRLWFFSKSGFRADARKRLQELGIWHSDIHGFNTLCQTVGIGVLPVLERDKQ